MKAAVLGSRKSLEKDRDAPAPKTATQEAMQAEVKSAALQKDTLKASALAAEVSTTPQGTVQAKPVVLLIHGGAQGGWVWSYPHQVCSDIRLMHASRTGCGAQAVMTGTPVMMTFMAAFRAT